MEIVKVYNTADVVNFQNYEIKDDVLIVSSFTNMEMDPNVDVVELIAYGETDEFLDYIVDIKTYKLVPDAINPITGLTTKIELDPKADAVSFGFDRGRLSLQYNFLKPLFNSTYILNYWIKEISPSRTEIKLSSQFLSNDSVRSGFSDFQAYVSSKNYYVDFYLNFGDNRLVIANNAAIVEENGQTFLLVKLYEPLPSEFTVKDTMWICDKVSDPVIYVVDIQIEVDVVADPNALRGPNWKIKTNESLGQTTPYYNYNALFSSNFTSSMQMLSSYYEDKGIEINVDYTNFSNFVHFSSAVERINNFVYKLNLIEQYEAEIQESSTFSSLGNATQTAVVQANNLIQSKIDSIIEKFDVYEYYLYFSSESFAWPKSTSTKPYSLYSTTSSIALNWLGDEYTLPSTSGVSMLYSASYYDDTNSNKLSNAIPQYLLDDPNNAPYVTFIDMIGQHFDNVWLYYKDLSNRYSSFNSPNFGISKDVIADALRSFGFNLYTNTSVSDNLYYTLFGMNPDGSLLPPTGSELITNYVTSSIDTLSPKDLNAEIYKRLYHNLTYLLKTKGTQRGVKALICSYGIPEEILTINEFGGNNRYTGSGIFEINNNKISYFTSSQELSNPVLSPYVTLQQYNTDYRINVPTIESGFSPADQINRNIVSSSGFVNLDQLIGNPTHQYLEHYPDLKAVRDNYFASYNYPHSIWEYIRIIKYYNNSLFKTIKDFVPARSNPSTGIIVKSHILERNKYARHEPSMSFDNNISESLDMISIDGSDPGAIDGSTQYTANLITPLGFAPYSVLQNEAKFTGELSGSHIQATNGEAFDQSDYSTTSSGSIEVDYPATYQNLVVSSRSTRFLELDYSNNQNQPVNLGLVTQSILDSINDYYNTYTDPNNPYADIQDYNYYTRAFTDSRYYGSRVSSLLYNKYTSASLGYVGDSSYGKTAAIDKLKYKYAYLVDIYTASIYMPNRSNAQIKYLIDNESNTLNLTKANINIFDVQNLFKSGETTDVALFQYDEDNAYSQLLANNPTLQIYEGGWRYLPILHNLSGSSQITQSFALTNPLTITTYFASNATLSDFSVGVGIARIGSSTTRQATVIFPITASYSNSPALDAAANVFINYDIEDGLNGTFSYGNSAVVTIPAASFNGYLEISYTVINNDIGQPGWPDIAAASTFITPTIANVQVGNVTNAPYTYYTSEISGSQPCLYILTSSGQIVFDYVIAEYYQTYGMTYNSTSDPAWLNSGLPTTVIPFSLTPGDRISFFDSASRLGWDERFEYVVKSATITGSGTGSRLLVDVDKPINIASFVSQSGAGIDATTGANYKACRYIVWKHVPDETNIMLKYNPKTPTIIEEGLLYPQYLEETVKENAGNVVQRLKANNLI